MLVAAAIASVWARRSEGFRAAVLILGAVTVFAVVSYGVEIVRHRGAAVPESITVDGRPHEIGKGKVLVYFFNPACTHCFEVAKRMSTLAWNEAQVVAVPVESPLSAPTFLADTGLKAVWTSDFEKLREPLGYHAYPYAVLLVDGRQKLAMGQFEGDEPTATLRRLGFVR